jgi:hypothetical protein
MGLDEVVRRARMSKWETKFRSHVCAKATRPEEGSRPARRAWVRTRAQERPEERRARPRAFAVAATADYLLGVAQGAFVLARSGLAGAAIERFLAVALKPLG